MAPRTTPVWIIYCALIRIAATTPAAAFPFNSQVPAVARVNTPYNFQVSDSTFAPSSTNFSYSLSNNPAWLSIDSATRTLTGIPGQGDVGSSEFTLTAADGTGSAHMGCTLVVSQDTAPQMSGDISKQLAATANLSSSHPPVVTLLPSTVFQFDFQQESFIDIVQRKLYYYATLSDRTPLPSWLKFDTTVLTFSGTAPSLSAFPQSWEILLIASDVPGFSAATTSFTMAIGIEQLAFVPEEQEMNVTAGRHIAITSLGDQLFRNGARLPAAEWQSAEASSLPSWLSFDATTLAIEGNVPEDVEQQNFTVTVKDASGNAATAIVNLVPNNATLFDGQIGTIVADAGDTLRYHFDDDLFTEDDLDLSVTFPPGLEWLRFDPETRELVGTVPTTAKPTAVRATLTAASSDGEGQSQVFTIDVKAAAVTNPSSSSPTTRTLPTHSSSSTSGAELVSERASSGPSGGIIAAIVVLSLIGAVLLVICLAWCCRRRRRRRHENKSPTPSQKPISRPIPPPEGGDTITVTTELQRDVEKGAGSDEEADSAAPLPRTADQPPQIMLNSLDLPSHPASRRSRWSKRFSRLSHASSIGQGDAAIRADSNIPEWGQDAPGLHTPHDSFSVPAEMARNSRHLSQLSPSKRAQRASRDARRSGSHVGLGITTSAIGSLARHSSKRVDKHRRGRSSFGGLSTTREASSMASITTTRTSLLSTRPSEFPQPPQSEHATSLSIPALSINTVDTLRDPKRKSIRMVQRSDSVADNRPVDVKRQSFIHNRAAAVKDRSRASVQSPLFAHGSRASSLHTRQTSRSANTSSAGSLRRTRRSKNGKSMLTTYSESSSLEPQPLQTRMSDARESKRLSQRVKSTFAPNFPRVMSQSIMITPDEDGEYITTESSMNSNDSSEDEKLAWVQDMHKPRHERDWVLTNEASPTPPPARSESQQRSRSRLSASPATGAGVPKPVWKDRLHDKSSSPLSSNVQVIEPSSVSPSRKKTGNDHHNRLSEPIDLVSADSMHKARPRLAHTKSRRPVSVEEVQRLSSMKAEQDEATTAGSEQWYDTGSDESDVDGAGLVPRMTSGRVGTQKSDMSGPAFL
ncbi:hypothetical protein PRZ48_012304 [Zasmidium cellare]|uniref:Dystroglycan-type cadherin-like domain-containing protein n=1 Tax=Zasmidium cellare TaxID=395010 RepID=A0ABR0E4I0_ZASCE|nr:hypothetical protein PRZ48_012304 [Zasmidium cellare]